MAMKRFLANEWDRLRAEKRGGGQAQVAFDTALGERLFLQEGSHSLAPDTLYERRWALALLEEALARLQRDQLEAGKALEYEQLKPHLTAERGEIPYTAIAAALGTSEGAARVAVHRLRKRFREIFRETLADTVSAPEELEDERRHVLAVLSQESA
jgi:RNA polymerase sigma-70 factor (ECF subfamily)